MPETGRFSRSRVWWCVVAGILIAGVLVWLYEHEIDYARSSKEELTRFKRIIVYDVSGLDPISNDDLNRASKAEISEEKTRRILQHVRFHRGLVRIWKGTLLGEAELDDGTKKRLVIGLRGEAFVVSGVSGCFEGQGDSRKEFSSTLLSIIQDQFIPERRRKNSTQPGTPATAPASQATADALSPK